MQGLRHCLLDMEISNRCTCKRFLLLINLLVVLIINLNIILIVVLDDVCRVKFFLTVLISCERGLSLLWLSLPLPVIFRPLRLLLLAATLPILPKSAAYYHISGLLACHLIAPGGHEYYEEEEYEAPDGYTSYGCPEE